MKNKYFLVIVFIIALAIVTFLLNKRTGSKTSSNSVKIAAIINLTGPPSQFDAIKKKTIELALDRCKVKYDKSKIEYLILDAGGSSELTKAAVKKALDWKCDVILSGTSPTALSIAKDVRSQDRDVIQIANAANPAFGLPNKLEYRFWPDWNQEAALVSKVFDTSKYKKVFLIYSADPYSEALAKSLKEKRKDLDISEYKYDPSSATDFRPYLVKAKQDGVEAIVIFGLPPGIKSLISQLSDVSWKGDLIGGVNISLAVQEFDKANLPGALWVLQTESMKDSLQTGSEAQIFRSEFKVKYNESPPFHSLYLADAIYWIANCSLNGKDSLIAGLKKINSFEGSSGTIRINSDASIYLKISAEKIRGKNRIIIL